MASDEVCKDVIALGNELTFKQVYDLAKVEERTKVHVKIISKGEEKSDLHTVERESAHSIKNTFTHLTPYCYWQKTLPIPVQTKRLPGQISKLACKKFKMQVLRQCKSVHATTPLRGSSDRE